MRKGINIRFRKKEKTEDKKRIGIISRLRRRPPQAADTVSGDSGFDAVTASTEPILRMEDVKKQASWKKDLAINCSCAVLLTAVIALFCMVTGSAGYIPFALTCPLAFMAVSEVSSVKPGIAKWIAANIVLVILLATAIIWRDTLFNSIFVIVNRFYDAAEEAQAYLYDRLPAEGDASGSACKAGIAWVSGVIGLLAALPPAGLRRAACVLISSAVMIAFAYYGLIPSAVCIAVFIAALLAAVSRGSVLSAAPVLLAALLIFGAIVLINPGENYAISRVDENMRDMFALNSALLEGGESDYDEYEEEEYEEEEYDEEEEDEEYYEEDEGISGTYVVYGIIIAVAAVIIALAFFLLRRYSKRRAQNRRGIDSKDPREAVAAMFPYTVRWLRGYGIEQTDAAFTSMLPSLREKFADPYPDRFCLMYNVWSEAAYSDHDIPEENRWLMETFMKDTIDQINDRCKFREKIKLRLRHAL